MTIKEIITKDGSVTYHNETFDESYHSRSGAIEESFIKYVEPCNLARINKESVSILDFCFGLGYNSIVALAECMKNPKIKKIKLTGIELDPEIVSKIEKLKLDFEELDLIKELVVNKEVKKKYKDKELELSLLINDAAAAVKVFDSDYFDVVLFDPFSPKKHPELWSEEVFKDLYSKMKKDGILTTYSCARVVRDNLKSAKFNVFDGPKLHRRGPSTIAIK